MAIKAVLFDCFGVLVGMGFDDVYRRAGGDPSKDRQFVHDILAAANSGMITTEEMSRRVTDKLAISLESWDKVMDEAEQPNKPLLEYVQSLKPKHKIAIISNANHGVLESRLSKAQLDLFDAVVVSAEVGFLKPDKQIFEYAAKMLDVELNECVFTDDSEGFCEAACQLGIASVVYKDFMQCKTDIGKLLADSDQ